MMLPDNFPGMLTNLQKKTVEGKINWIPAVDIGMGTNEDDFVASFPDYSINIWNDNDDIRVSIINSSGRNVFSVEITGQDPLWKLAFEILQRAKFIAFNVDKAIDYLNTMLEEEGIVGQSLEKAKQSTITNKDPYNDDIPF